MASHLTRMDRASRALWQALAAKVRERRASYRYGRDLAFVHDCHLFRARTGQPWDPLWWS